MWIWEDRWIMIYSSIFLLLDDYLHKALLAARKKMKKHLRLVVHLWFGPRKCWCLVNKIALFCISYCIESYAWCRVWCPKEVVQTWTNNDPLPKNKQTNSKTTKQLLLSAPAVRSRLAPSLKTTIPNSSLS